MTTTAFSAVYHVLLPSRDAVQQSSLVGLVLVSADYRSLGMRLSFKNHAQFAFPTHPIAQAIAYPTECEKQAFRRQEQLL